MAWAEETKGATPTVRVPTESGSIRIMEGSGRCLGPNCDASGVGVMRIHVIDADQASLAWEQPLVLCGDCLRKALFDLWRDLG